MSEDYRKQVEDAVKAVRREEGRNKPFSDEDAKRRIEWHLADNFVKSWDGKGPVPDSLFKLLNWASYEYFLHLLKAMRHQDTIAEHESRQKKRIVTPIISRCFLEQTLERHSDFGHRQYSAYRALGTIPTQLPLWVPALFVPEVSFEKPFGV